jgi:hypothetical protein
MTDFFAQAAQSETKTKSKEKVKKIVPVDADGKIKLLMNVRQTMADLEAQEALLVDDLRPVANEAFLKEYEKAKVRPESFMLQDTDGAKTLLIVQDRYIKVTDGIEQAINSMYGAQAKEIIGKSTEFKFNSDVLDEHGPVIFKAISAAIASMDIPEDAKKKLLKAETKTVIKKGLIERLHTFPNFQTLYGLIKPVLQFKNQS